MYSLEKCFMQDLMKSDTLDSPHYRKCPSRDNIAPANITIPMVLREQITSLF